MDILAWSGLHGKIGVDGVNWYELPATPWSRRHATSVFTFNGDLWLVAGFLVNDVWKLHLTDTP